MMVYKTLHWYVFRELLRIFFLAASALTTLMAFGGTFKPLTRQGLEITQLLMLIGNLMPAMLAYAIPIAALFAAVLVYWRLSTDNEMTACRASGISFVSIVMPALVLGLMVASIDLVFVNYVVPVFLQRTERAVISDLGGLLTSQINQSQKFEFGPLTVYADAAREEPPVAPNTARVVLNGMAVLLEKSKGKPEAIVVAREANVTITNKANDTDAYFTFQLSDAAGFNPATFQKISGSIPELNQGGRPIPVPSQLRSKPKFLNREELVSYKSDPSGFRPVKVIIDRIEDKYNYGVIAGRLYDEWKDRSSAGDPMALYTAAAQGSGKDLVRIYAPNAILDAERQLSLVGTAGHPVRVETYRGTTPYTTYTCNSVGVDLASDDFTRAGITGSLQLRGNVFRKDNVRNIGPDPSGPVSLPDLVLSPALTTVTPVKPLTLYDNATTSGVKSMQRLGADATTEIQQLFRSIASELHSRGSFSLSCLTLVLLGAALGLLMRGKNPLAVFVVGFVPAVLMVLLITAGREMAEGSAKTATAGILLIWSGNVVLLAMVVAVYAKLLRH